jgi:hypothetical protein
MLRRLRSIAIVFAALLAASGSVATSAWAQARKAPPAAAKGRGPAKPPAKTPPAASSAPASGEGGSFGAAAAATPVGLPGAAAPVDGGVVETKTLDGGTQVFKFKELDIEGRLKSPQLVYFLRRVRAEFAAGDLGHRSFLREMSETRKEPSF